VRVDDATQIDWGRLGLDPPEALVATGYGKHLLKAHFPTITEIRAHFLGARFVTGLDHFILLEMGGQDTKVLYIREGRVFDFLTNDRCAAGTGRYLENMARFLKMPLAEFAGCWQDPVDISQTCAIFGETELVGHLLEGVELARIAAGVNASVARRALAMVRRYRCPTLVFVGGVAKNRAVVKLLVDQGLFKSGCRLIPNSTAPWVARSRRAGSWPGKSHELPGRRGSPGPGPEAPGGEPRLVSSPVRGGFRRTFAFVSPSPALHLPRRRLRSSGEILLRLSPPGLRGFEPGPGI